MRLSDNLKAYTGHFQSKLTKVHNRNKDVSALAFISVLQVTHPLYKHF